MQVAVNAIVIQILNEDFAICRAMMASFMFFGRRVCVRVSHSSGMSTNLLLRVKSNMTRKLVCCSISAQEVLQAIESQTGRKLDSDMLDLPTMKKLGTYEISAQLHPNVVGKFKVLVQKQKEQQK